ncbi:MAG: flagellar FliJ family protein [Paucibacter sp.]|nr:flagellar FliJ family protein [Roseateles sp.]
MSKQLHVNLGRLRELSERARDQAQTHFAEQQRRCERIAGNVDKLEALAGSAAPTAADGRLTAALLANQGAYKDTVLDLARGQRKALDQSRADAAAAQAALISESRREAALDKARSQVGARLALDARRQEQKQQDALASQSWLRGDRP